jgi:hypothetical protein
MQVSNRANLSPEQFAQVKSEVTKHRTLRDVFNWGLSQRPGTVHPRIISEVVIQDEFSQDVIVPWRDGLVLVYATT